MADNRRTDGRDARNAHHIIKDAGRNPCPTRRGMVRQRWVLDTLRERAEAGLHLGTLRPGDRLGSARSLSKELHTDPRAILAAYRQLAAEGLVSLRPRSGAFVREVSGSTGGPLPDVAAWLVDVMLRGLDRGIAPADLARQALSCLDGPRPRALCLECNTDQIHSLERQLDEDYGFDVAGLDTDGPGPGRGALDVDLVVTTRFHATRAKAVAGRLRCPFLVATLDPRFVTELREMLARGPVWWICTDPRFAAKLPRIWPGWAVRPVVLGRDDLQAVPRGASVYASRAARERLPAGWHGGRVVTIARVLSAETARALVAFRLRHGLQSPSSTRHRSTDRRRAAVRVRT
jgi:hypothetical protein